MRILIFFFFEAGVGSKILHAKKLLGNASLSNKGFYRVALGYNRVGHGEETEP